MKTYPPRPKPPEAVPLPHRKTAPTPLGDAISFSNGTASKGPSIASIRSPNTSSPSLREAHNDTEHLKTVSRSLRLKRHTGKQLTAMVST